MPDETYYITTTIPYVNAKPHLGHALEFVQTDAFGRYHRLRGDDTYVLTGTDENSLTNVLAAEREGISPRALVDRNSALFQALAEHLDVAYDQFIRTAVDPRHAAGAQKLWQAVAASGDIYQQHYRGLYCVRCEQYYDESELVDGLCPDHLIPPEEVEEENYFFRLSRYGDRLEELIASDRLHIIPTTRKNEVLSFIRQGLKDFSVSRSRERAHGWGISVPGDPSQVMYVWFDALTNYITALDYAQDGALYRQYWEHNPNRVHALGKNVIKFHAIYWPAMLLSAGVPLPCREFVHGFINLDDKKMSKSLGNVIDPEELLSTYGAEAVRYYLLRAASPTGDSNFSSEGLEARYNADLANDLGNLLNRTVSMIARYRGGTIGPNTGNAGGPSTGRAADLECSVQDLASSVLGQVEQAMDAYDPQTALDSIWELVTRTNKYVEESAPWTLSKAERGGDVEAQARLDTALATLAEAVRIIGVLLEPFLPTASRQIAGQMGTSEIAGSWRARLQWGRIEPGTTVGQAKPIFPRLEDSK